MQFYAFNDGGQTFFIQGTNPMNALAALRNWLQSRGWGATDVQSVSERDLQPVSEQSVNRGYLVNAAQTQTAGGGQGMGSGLDQPRGVGGKPVQPLGGAGIAQQIPGGLTTTGNLPIAGAPIGGPRGAENDPASLYRRALDQANITSRTSPFRSYLEDQYGPANDVFNIRAAVGTHPEDFQSFTSNLLGQAGDFSQGITRQAGDVWSQLLNQIKTGGNSRAEPYTAANPEDNPATEIANLARRAAREKYGVVGAGFLPGSSESIARYRAQPALGGGTQTAFTDYLRQLYGI